jgi:membrane protease subunit HflC
MSATSRFVAGIAVLLLIILVLSSTFVVQQTQQALVFRFGSVARAPINEPGLYFKLPIIENVVTVDKRILDLELPQQEVIASDQKRLVVDAFTRYRIVDPLRFYQSSTNVAGANLRLTSIVNSSVRTILADATLSTVVRADRSGLMHKIRDDVNQQAQGLGLQIVDVRLRRADLPEQNSQAVFQRMQTERQREAADIRAQGSQFSQTIKAKADRDVVVLRADATNTSEKVRGEGDAQKSRILAEAYGQDAEFFGFYRSLLAYETAFKPGETRLVLSPESEFLRYFKDPFSVKNGE